MHRSDEPRHMTVNVTREDIADIDAIVSYHRPWVSRHAVHRAALREGLAVLRLKPTRLVELIAQDRVGTTSAGA